MRAIENISQELFDKIRSRVDHIRLGDEQGAVTTDPTLARFFEFSYKNKGMPIGAVTISLNEEGILQVYFPNSMVEDVDSQTADAWYSFLKEMSRFAMRNMLNYETHNVTKERLDKKDYQFLTQRNQDEVMENKLYGTSQKSFLNQGTAKIIIQHNKTVDETKLGARSRNINAIYIENSQGERFKFANNYLPGARAMARHVSNEGHTRDDRGQHIVSIMDEMNELKTFVRTIKREEYVTEEQNEIIEAATDRYYGLKDTLKNLASASGYQEYFENWVPEAVEDEGDLEDLKNKLTREVYDDRLTSSLPSVRRAMEQRAKIREGDFNDVSTAAMGDDPIEVFDNPAKKAEIDNYMDYIKNSDMEAQRKNMALVVAIMKYLADNATDDKLANAMSSLDVEDKKHMALAYALAKKFITGNVKVKEKAPKKDKFGKEKTESITFEAYEQSMDMITEGTWHLFSSEEDIKDFISLLQQPLKAGEEGEDAINAIMKFVGDDDMLDDIAEFADENGANKDARPAIIKWLKKNQYGGRYRYPEQYTDAIQAVLAGLKGKAESVEEAKDKHCSDKCCGSEVKAEDCTCPPTCKHCNCNAVEESNITEMKTLKCKHCGDMLGEPTTDCPHDSQDPSGDNWIMVDVDNDGDMDIAVANEEIEEVDEAAESIAKLKAMAGVGSKFRSNHGIHEGEEGYQITPRSIVARELRKLQDIEKGS